jgi:phage shock protein E
MLRRVFCIGLSIFLIGACDQVEQSNVNVNEALVIDVRTPEEWQDAHLADITLIPWQDIVPQTAQRHVAKDQPIAVFCRSGNRAAKAMALLNDAGYTQVVNLGSLEQAAETLGKPIIK